VKSIGKGKEEVTVNFTYESKITKQMGKRGWTDASIGDAIAKPVRTVETRDTRWLSDGSGRLDDPATAYYYRNGGYVVRNDVTGEITQVSDRFDEYWSAPWDNNQ
jgi:filamentous hemagglutinin